MRGGKEPAAVGARFYGNSCFRLANFLRERGKIGQAVEVVKANIKACEQMKVTVAEQVFDLLRSLRAQNKGRDQ